MSEKGKKSTYITPGNSYYQPSKLDLALLELSQNEGLI